MASFQKSTREASLQVSGFVRTTEIEFRPDAVQDLLFGGVASQVDNRDLVSGVQADASIFLSAGHTLRIGWLATYDQEKLNTRTAVFQVDDLGHQISDQPDQIIDQDNNHGASLGGYLQDEWRPASWLTVNYGARYDRFAASFDREGQVSPRINLVWKIDDATSFHAGYARYFMPPTLQYLPLTSVEKFVGTSNAPFSDADDPPKVERDHYFDVGVSHQIAPEWKVTADSFLKLARNLLDDGQFGSAVILNNFNYRRGTIYGAEVSSDFKRGPLSVYGNFSYVQTAAQQVNSVQFEFPDDELAYIAAHSIQLDHQGRFTGSGGLAYTWARNTHLYTDFLYGNGLRAGFANLEKLPSYATENLGVEHVFHLSSGPLKELKLRLDCLNVLNENYELRNGSGLGIAAPAFGPRRAFYAGLSFGF